MSGPVPDAYSSTFERVFLELTSLGVNYDTAKRCAETAAHKELENRQTPRFSTLNTQQQAPSIQEPIKEPIRLPHSNLNISPITKVSNASALELEKLALKKQHLSLLAGLHRSVDPNQLDSRIGLNISSPLPPCHKLKKNKK